MPIAYTRRKIEHLRKQPEHVRLRAASLMTIASGVALVLIWAGVLLPLQIHFGRGDNNTNNAPVATEQAIAPTPLPTTGVAGAQDRVIPDNTVGRSLPSPTPFATILPNP